MAPTKQPNNTMTAIDIIKVIKDYGVTAVLVFAIFWLNSRLTDVESRLYNCLDERIKKSYNQLPSCNLYASNTYFIKPDEVKVKGYIQKQST